MSRSYHSKGREAQGAETRSRILDKARELFQSEGFDALTIEALARSAEVSVSTIYTLFQLKRGLLRALIDEALPPDERLALVAQVEAATSAEELLKMSAKIARQIYDAERSLGNLPELKEFEQEREERRYQRQEATAHKLVGQLKPGLDLLAARDILWALTGRDLYRMLVIQRGWDSDQFEEWLNQLLVRTLLRS